MSLFGDSDGGGEPSFESDNENMTETSEDESVEDMDECKGGDDFASSDEDEIERQESENNDNPDDECLIVNSSIDNNNEIAAATSRSQSTPAVMSSFSSSKSKQSILTSNGVRLWPPSGGKKLKSETWKHGGFKKDQKGILQKDVVYCAHCNFSTKYCNSPTNLQRHIEREHGDVLKELSDEPKLFQSKVTDFPTTSLAIVKKYPQDSQKQVNFKNLIITWVIKSLRPFIIVKDENLVKAFNLADPKLTIPSTDTIKSQVSKLDVKHTALLKKELESISFVTCTNDAGSSYGASSFIDVNIHWLTEDFKLG